MTVLLDVKGTSAQLAKDMPGSVLETADGFILVDKKHLLAVAAYLKETAWLDFNYLANVTSADYYNYFEVVYHLTSLEHNHRMVIKTRIYERENPTLDSVTGIWRGADLQEREIYDLMGITFSGHHNMKRILLWDGFNGHPLRKDYL